MQPAPHWDHLLSMTDQFGIFEHADGSQPRREHGYCLDDVARALVVASREPDPALDLARAARRYLDYTLGALDREGGFRNRRNADGVWQGTPSTDDHWGRAIWALGTAAVGMPAASDRDRARLAARSALVRRSPWPRATCYATLGAAALLHLDSHDTAARGFLQNARTTLAPPAQDETWPWPEPRLGYANAVLPEAWLAIGYALDDEVSVEYGLRLLGWLLTAETRDGHLSVTPVGGAGPETARPGFDQQPIEVTAIAEACRRAADITADPAWSDAVELCAAWFAGSNDAGLPMYDPETGGGFDGLHPDSVNLNQGAESTLAALATLQTVRSVASRHPSLAR